jgi:hypothetical protein
MNELVKLPNELTEIAKNVSVEKRNEVQSVLNHVFNGVSKMRNQLDSVVVTSENDKVNMKLATTIRLGVKQIRLDAEKTFDSKRKEVQQQMLSYKTEDQLWLKAKQTMQILTKEIEENAKWKEETRARFETEQRELKIQERVLKVAKFNTEISRFEFESMSDDMFTLFLSGIEKAYNDKIEAEKIAEQEKIAKEKAEAEERARIRLENEKLRQEAEKREKEEKERIIKEEKERKERESKERIEREKYEAELKKQREEKEAIIRQEAEKRERIQAELNAKAEAEQKAKKEAEAKEQFDLNKNDIAKVDDLIADLENLKTKYTFKSAKNKQMYADVNTLITKIINHIKH